MAIETILLVFAIIVGFYMAWNIGANDVANAIGTSVGSGALTLKKAVVLAALLEFSGAFFAGSEVSQTIQRGIVNPEIFMNDPNVLVCGMIACLLAAGVWLQVASYFGWPVSTTHTIVGAVLGFGMVYGGLDAVYWGTAFSILMSWMISPLLGAVGAYLFFNFIRYKIFFSADPIKSTKRIAPYFVFFVTFILTLVTLFKGLKNLHLNLSFFPSLFLSIGLSSLMSFLSYIFVSKMDTGYDSKKEERISPLVVSSLRKARKYLFRAKNHSVEGELCYSLENLSTDVELIANNLEKKISHVKESSASSSVEKIFAYLQVLSAACMAFAHGANDVANSIGPLSAVIVTLQTGTIPKVSVVPTWVLMMGGGGIVIGLATWGWRVVETIGKRITELTPSRGFSAEFGAAITILLASKMGLPISTTHTLVGAVLGVGLARGIGALNLNTVRDIVVSWVVTVPMGMILAIIFFYILRGFVEC